MSSPPSSSGNLLPPTGGSAQGAQTVSIHAEKIGRVVRLHFCCHAELPIGSFLRVTGSTLWAPGTSATDPSEAAPAISTNENMAFPVAEDIDLDTPPVAELYASSVEMVTTPETYPIWRTRKPVVLVINNNRKSVQHHYYRYLVVCPGATLDADGYYGDRTDPDDPASAALPSTSNEIIGSTTVMEWEDPFGTTFSDRYRRGEVSNVSITSSVVNPSMAVTRNDFRNLPYRTLDIDIKTGKPMFEDGEDTSDYTRIDHWNVADDVSFRPFRIREAIHAENRRKMQQRLSNVPSEGNLPAGLGVIEASEVGGADGDLSEADPDGDALMQVDGSSDSNAAPPPPPPRSASGTSSGGDTPTAGNYSSVHRVFFVCFHLPVTVVQNKSTGHWRASWSESILAKTEGSQILSAYESYWVGTVTTHPPLRTEEDKAAVRSILEEMNCIPIFLDPAVRQSHYYGFCKQVLWPAFHNIDLLDLSTSGWLSDPTNTCTSSSDWDQSRLFSWWECYRQVNMEFCTLLSSMARNQDIVWIHDYHLSLLPRQLSERQVDRYGGRITRNVFFLHIPFPTSQVFRELECGEEILEGMLHADVVGFHSFDHARHFLNAAKRILGLNYESLAGGLIGVGYQGRTVLISMSNVSIEPRMVDAALMLPSVKEGQAALKAKHEGRTIIGSMEIGQRLSGSALKLLAYERMLQDYPVWQSRVVLVQRLLIPGSRKADENSTVNELRSIVKRITDKFGPDVLDYQELSGTSLPMDKRLALWKATDIFMNTPLREGLNHWPMEYIYSHKEPETPGIVITSEFSAVSSILNGALRVNPYDIQMTVMTIDKALSMDKQEREGRRYRDIDFVSGCPSDKWVRNVLRDLKDATSRQPTGPSESNSQVATPLGGATPKRGNIVADSTAAFLSREASMAFSHLSFKALKKAYDATKRRVIITDFNGTIVLKEPPGKYLKREILGTSGNKPPPAVIDALQALCSDPRNDVYVVSGDSADNVLSALGHLPALGLAVSNGARFSPPVNFSAGENCRRWLTFDLGVDWDAVKRVALPVLSKYTARSNGSYVKLTSFSIGWSYYSCDPEWGALQAAHLVLELENELRAFDVRFVTLKGIIEIVPRKLNKGLIVKRVLRDIAARHPEGIDFIMCMGDDISDEKMFTSVFSFIAELGDEANSKPGPRVLRDNGQIEPLMDIPKSASAPDPLYCFTVAVGKKATHASTFVNDAQEVANALVMLAKGDIPLGGVPVWEHTTSSQAFGYATPKPQD